MNETANPHLVRTDHLAAEAGRMAAVLDGLAPDDWNLPLPACPGWTVRKAARHVGTAHRWVRAMVDSGTYIVPRSLELGLPPDNADLPDWIRAGAADLVAALRAAPADRPMWSWGSDQTAGFWSRRMLHEAAIHRGDIEMALGRTPDYDRAVAVDGVDEFLANLPAAASFAPHIGRLTGDGETLHLHATEPAGTVVNGEGAAEWLITLEPKGFRWGRAHAKGAAAIRGSVSDLYLFAWGRRKADDARFEVLGDHVLVDHWVRNATF